MRGGRIAGRAAWTTAGALSLAAHIVLLSLAIWLLGREPPPREGPVLSVQLVTLTPPGAPEIKTAPTRRPAAPARPAPRRPPQAPAEVAPLPLPPATAADPAPGVARALRDRLGCPPGDPARMAAEERERCRKGLAEAGAARDGSSPKLDLSRQGRITEDPEFDLSRRPKKGCKVRAAGSRDPMGKEGPAAGISCTWGF